MPIRLIICLFIFFFVLLVLLCWQVGVKYPSDSQGITVSASQWLDYYQNNLVKLNYIDLAHRNDLESEQSVWAIWHGRKTALRRLISIQPIAIRFNCQSSNLLR